MTNLFILNVIVEEDADYSQLVKDLTGGFVATDIETTTKDKNGEEVVSTIPHPHADLPAPDFSEKIIFAHFEKKHKKIDGVDHIVISKFKGTTAWNEGVAYARSKGATHVAILNSVTGINPHTISLGFDGNEDKSVINLGDGAAFIVDAEFSVDETYNFWFIDNAIFSDAQEAGSYALPRIEQSAILQADLTSSKEAFLVAINEDYKTAGIV
jgi:hypothetical protein